MLDVEIARICHEANRALQLVHNDPGIPVAPVWDEMPADQQATVIEGVQHARAEGMTPELSHELWCRAKRRDGWRYGPVKDTEQRLHPCLVDFDQLPEEQQVKDRLFLAVAHALIGPAA